MFQTSTLQTKGYLFGWFLFFLSKSQDFLLHMPLGNSGSQQESVGGGRITVGAQTVPAADLSNSSPSDIACNCEACNERR